jgi:hypothetical protein
MSRSGYSDDCDDYWQHIRWRGAVASAMRGKKGQAFLKELLAALDAMPRKRLIPNELEVTVPPEVWIVDDRGTVYTENSVCALGQLGQTRNMDLSKLDPEDYGGVAGAFDVNEKIIQEIVYTNDESFLGTYSGGRYYPVTPEERWRKVRAWVANQIWEWRTIEEDVTNEDQHRNPSG